MRWICGNGFGSSCSARSGTRAGDPVAIQDGDNGLEVAEMPYRDPEKQRAYQREYRRMQRAGSCATPSQTQISLPFRLKTAHDVLALLEEQVHAIRAEPAAGTLEKARAIGYLAGIALKA